MKKRLMMLLTAMLIFSLVLSACVRNQGQEAAQPQQEATDNDWSIWQKNIR